MSDTTTTDPVPEAAMVPAEVKCAGVSYFTKEFVRDSTGEKMINQTTGQPVVFEERHEAFMGDKIELSQFEFDRLAKLSAVQEPGSAPLPGSAGAPPAPTPFGVPLPDPENPGEMVAWQGPIGDPRPHGGDDASDRTIVMGSQLTQEEVLELERRAREGVDGNEGDDSAGLYDSYMELSKDELKDEATTESVTVERSDGRTDIEPTKEDYARALTEHAEAQELGGRDDGDDGEEGEED